MRTLQLQRFLISATRLTSGQQLELLAGMGAGRRDEDGRSILESQLIETQVYSHRDGARMVPDGTASGRQRCRRQTCCRTFKTLIATALARLRMKAKWRQTQNVLPQGLNANNSDGAQGVAATTAPRWQQRFLHLAQAVKTARLTAQVGADEKFFFQSSKGQHLGCKARNRGARASRKEGGVDLIPILAVRDRLGGATAASFLEADSKDRMSDALGPCVNSYPVLYTDGSASMAAVAGELRLHLGPLSRSAGEQVRGPWHIQNVIAHHCRPKPRTARFRGVVTSQLENYLGWFRAVDCASNDRQASASMLKLAAGLRGVTSQGSNSPTAARSQDFRGFERLCLTPPDPVTWVANCRFRHMNLFDSTHPLSFVAVFIRQLICASLAMFWLGATAQSTGTESYGYDALGRMIRVTHTNGTVIQYSYDAAGNRKSTGPEFSGGGTIVFVSGVHTSRGVMGDIATATIRNSGTVTITGSSHQCSGGSFYVIGNSTPSIAPGATASYQCRAAASGSMNVIIRVTGTGAGNSPFSTPSF